MTNKLISKVVIVISLFMVTVVCNAQWVLTNKPQDVNIIGIYSFAVNGETVYAGTDTSELADHGGAVFVSTNSGMDWINSSKGIGGGEVRALALSGDTVFAGTFGGGVFMSPDSGANWSGVNNGLTSLFVWALAVNDSNIFAGTYGGGVSRSSDNGANWIGVNNGLTNPNILSLVVSDTTIFAGTEDGIFRTTDNGDNWIKIDDDSVSSQYGAFQCLAVNGSHIFVGSTGGLFHSPDNGTNWSNVSSGLPYSWVMDIELLDANIFALTNWGNISLSTDYGSNWTIINEGVIDTVISAIAVSDSLIFADAGYGYGIMRASLNSILTGIDEKERAGLLPSDIKLIQNYPNPVIDLLTIKTEAAGTKSIVFYSLNGQLIYSGEMEGNTHQIDMSAFSKGVYFVTVRSKEFVRTETIIKYR